MVKGGGFYGSMVQRCEDAHVKFLAPWISHQNSCRMFIPPSSFSTHGRSHSHISLCRDEATFRLMKSSFRFSEDRPFFPQAFNLDMKGYMPVARQCAVFLDEVSASLWGDTHQAGEGFYFKFYHHIGEIQVWQNPYNVCWATVYLAVCSIVSDDQIDDEP